MNFYKLYDLFAHYTGSFSRSVNINDLVFEPSLTITVPSQNHSIQEVEIQIKQQELNQEQLARFIKWKNWATKHADRLNPVKQKIDSILNPVEEDELKLSLW